MATLTVRNLPDELVKLLRVRAAEHGRSAEAEHRDILRSALVGDGTGPDHSGIDARLRNFRERTAGRGGPPALDLIHEGRDARMKVLSPDLE